MWNLYVKYSIPILILGVIVISIIRDLRKGIIAKVFIPKIIIGILVVSIVLIHIITIFLLKQ